MEVFVDHKFAANSALARALVAAGAQAIHNRMESITHEVEAEVERLISQKLRPRGGYREKEGDIKLEGSIRVEVDWNGSSFPVTINVGSTADPEKVASLEFGSTQTPHWITGNPFLYYPSNQVSRARGGQHNRGLLGRNFNATGDGPNLDLGPTGGFESFNKPRGRATRGGRSKNLVKAARVWHPGNPAFHFMQQGLDRVVRRVLARG